MCHQSHDEWKDEVPSTHSRRPSDVHIMASPESLHTQDTASLASEPMAINLEETILDLDNNATVHLDALENVNEAFPPLELSELFDFYSAPDPEPLGFGIPSEFDIDMHCLGSELNELSYEDGNREIDRKFGGADQTNCTNDDKDMNYNKESVTHSSRESIEDGHQAATRPHSYSYSAPSAANTGNSIEQSITLENSQRGLTMRANFSLWVDIGPQNKPSEHDEDKLSEYNEVRLIERGSTSPGRNAHTAKMKRRLDSSGGEGTGKRMRQKLTTKPQMQDNAELKIDQAIDHLEISVSILTQECGRGSCLNFEQVYL